MAEIKLAKLPDRTPVKVTLAVMPELHDRLAAYAAFYTETYGSEESIALSGQSAPCLSLH